jgi:fumarylacetoacetate (FAA) hydrolase
VKFATLVNGTRDGKVVIVSRDAQRCRPIERLALTLQQVLDAWADLEPRLQAIYADMNRHESAQDSRFNLKHTLAPLPRAYHWVDGSAYVPHIELVRRARGADMPLEFWTDPIVYQGGSDDLLGPFADVSFGSTDQGIDFEAELGVIVTDVPPGTRAAEAAPHIKLLTLINDWSLRALIPRELGKGFGFYQSKPATGFAGIVVTPDELGAAWDGCKAIGPVGIWRNGEWFGCPIAGTDMMFDFPSLIEHAARTRRLGAGTIVGAGTICNRDESRGCACIAERRAREIIRTGAAVTPYFDFGESVRIEMCDVEGRSIFGPIAQRVVRWNRPKADTSGECV